MYLDYEAYFRHVQKIKQCLCLMLFSVFIYRKLNSNYYGNFYLFPVFKLYKSSPQIIHLILDYLIFLGSFNIGNYLVVAYIGRFVLTLAQFSDAFFRFFSDCTCQTIFWTWTLSYLKVFSISIHKKALKESKHYLLLLAIFHDLEMTQFQFVNCICLVYKLTSYFLYKSKSLGNIYDKYLAIVFGALSFSTFWRLCKLFF